MENIRGSIAQLENIHKKVNLKWRQKRKYFESMKRAQSYVWQVEKRESTSDRVKLIEKLNYHIYRVMGQYSIFMDELSQLNRGAQKIFGQLSEMLASEQEGEQIQEVVSQYNQIKEIVLNASQFV